MLYFDLDPLQNLGMICPASLSFVPAISPYHPTASSAIVLEDSFYLHLQPTPLIFSLY